MIETSVGIQMDDIVLEKYLRSLINLFFKILPIKESGEKSLGTYLRSLQLELIGCRSFVVSIQNDASFLTMLSVLQYMIDSPDCSVSVVKREVFRCISLCNKLIARYTDAGKEEALK